MLIIKHFSKNKNDIQKFEYFGSVFNAFYK